MEWYFIELIGFKVTSWGYVIVEAVILDKADANKIFMDLNLSDSSTRKRKERKVSIVSYYTYNCGKNIIILTYSLTTLAVRIAGIAQQHELLRLG